MLSWGHPEVIYFSILFSPAPETLKRCCSMMPTGILIWEVVWGIFPLKMAKRRHFTPLFNRIFWSKSHQNEHTCRHHHQHPLGACRSGWLGNSQVRCNLETTRRCRISIFLAKWLLWQAIRKVEETHISEVASFYFSGLLSHVVRGGSLLALIGK